MRYWNATIWISTAAAVLAGTTGCHSSGQPSRGVIQRPVVVSENSPSGNHQRDTGLVNESAITHVVASESPAHATAPTEPERSSARRADKHVVPASAVVQKSASRESESSPRRPLFDIPKEVPGSDAPPLRVPPSEPNETEEARAAKIDKLYRPLAAVRSAEPSAETTEWTLAALEAFAFEHSPAIQQAAAQAEAARGAVIQAGLYPNPTVGYEADTVRTLDTNGYQGIFFEQQIVTGGKLDLKQSAAAMAHHNACLAIQKAKADVATQVRDAYYDYLVAQQRLRLARALAQFTDNIYRAQIDQVKADQAAAYEPLQLRVFGSHARNAVVASENAERAAWRRLAAALGATDLANLNVAGDADRTVPELHFEAAKATLLETHTDLLSAKNSITQARYQQQLECVRPKRPDLSLYGAVQHDYTGAPFGTTYNLQVGVPLPLFDRNQGNILQAQSQVLGNDRALADKQNELTARLADAFARYHTARQQAAMYRNEILPDQVRVYRGIYTRYQQDHKSVSFSDIVVAQQSLGSAVTSYTDALSEQWQAYVDIAGLLQLEDSNQLEQFAVPTTSETPPSPAP